MPEIRLLDKSVAELIAAGEVIERPSSVIKELVENSIDAGARHITVEIKHGGISYMRITDDGCGIAYEQMPTAFLRHATSKIRTGDDLTGIMTMGFRGEALASVAAVAKIEMMSRRAEDELGGRYVIEGGEEKEHESCGCPVGTTIVIKELFYNTPARLKFLKKDISEGNFIAATVDRLALSHPDISFKFIRDNKSVRMTSGDGSLLSAAKAVFGRQFADSLIPVDFSLNGIDVSGYASSPLFCRNSRSMQTFFVNTRYIKSTTCMAALEEAYRNSMMVGKFPACILDISLSPESVDVNVHPAKTEIRFAYEKPVFDAVYFAVKNALVNAADDRRQIELEKPKKYDNADDYFKRNPEIIKREQQTLEHIPVTLPLVNDEYPVEKAKSEETPVPVKAEKIYGENPIKPVSLHSSHSEYIAKPSESNTDNSDDIPLPEEPHIPSYRAVSSNVVVTVDDDMNDIHADNIPVTLPAKDVINDDGFRFINAKPVTVEKISQPEPEKINIRVIGEFLKTYILCEVGEELIIIDKHAAHERIRFEKLKEEFITTSQLLIDKTELKLSPAEYEALHEYYEYVEQSGIELVFCDDCTVQITAMPSVVKCSPQEIVADVAQRLMNTATDQKSALFDDMLHTMACKSAIKAHDDTGIIELQALAERVLNDKTIRFCPHGRPVMTSLSKYKIEHFFNRS